MSGRLQGALPISFDSLRDKRSARQGQRQIRNRALRQDIVVADERRKAVVWFENPGVAFCAGWRRHLVDQSDVYLR